MESGDQYNTNKTHLLSAPARGELTPAPSRAMTRRGVEIVMKSDAIVMILVETTV